MARAVVLSCLVVTVVHADGGRIGRIFAVEGEVAIQRGCETLLVRDDESLRILDTLITGPNGHARVRAEGFGHLDLDPQSSVRIDLFYRSPNESVQGSVLEFSIFSGSARFISESRRSLETRFRFHDAVVSMRDAAITIAETRGIAVMTLIGGESVVSSDSHGSRHQRVGDTASYTYRQHPWACSSQ